MIPGVHTFVLCVWLLPTVLYCSAMGLALGHNDRWLKLLPVCTFGLAIMTLFMISEVPAILDFIPPRVVLAGMVACLGGLLFSDRRGWQAVVCGNLVASLFVLIAL